MTLFTHIDNWLVKLGALLWIINNRWAVERDNFTQQTCSSFTWSDNKMGLMEVFYWFRPKRRRYFRTFLQVLIQSKATPEQTSGALVFVDPQFSIVWLVQAQRHQWSQPATIITPTKYVLKHFLIQSECGWKISLMGSCCFQASGHTHFFVWIIINDKLWSDNDLNLAVSGLKSWFFYIQKLCLI